MDNTNATLEQIAALLAVRNPTPEIPGLARELLEKAAEHIRAQAAELESERMRLAACGVVALANTPESAAPARDMHPDYRSASCDEVARLVDREMALRAELERGKAGPNYKFKFEALVEHCKRQDTLIAEHRYDLNIARLYHDGAVWFWAGDETDNLPTLACPVVINAGDLRALTAAAPTAPAQGVQEPHTFWVLFDATAEQQFIKKMLPEGFLAFFDCESDARQAKARNPGTDYKRVDYYTAPPAAEQPDMAKVQRELLENAARSCANGWIDYPTAQELRALLHKDGGA